MYYANYDESTGEILGFYNDEIHEEIPAPHIELTEEEWQQAVSGSYRIIDGALTEYVYQVTTEDMIAEVQRKYEAKLIDLRTKYAIAEINENTAVMETLKAKNIQLINDFNNYIDSLNGTVPRDVGSTPDMEGYCPICGSEINNGACTQCRWRKL